MALPDQATQDYLTATFKSSLKSPTKIPVLDLGGGKSVSGVCSIAKHLQRTSKDFTGLNLEERMEVEQWIEYASATVKFVDSESERLVLKELNNWLKDKAFFVANKLTVADVIMFYNLYSAFAERLTFQEKELFIHLSRWFHNVQQDNKVRQSLQHLTFLRTPVYDGVRVH
ncbi:eukaryotic translation elongation factor 1 epsilon-1 [Elysia marginata]|uniref:Eukaryotic translation elongation factor 1 epsilon-1 n=1 Tax=Elysia marginata TaxID=1093978 RepID=A0AAV4EVI6_9GAST|nr:eukaryotic translation elongation factor 1 epsilon-1 [Elysia marginata]